MPHCFDFIVNVGHVIGLVNFNITEWIDLKLGNKWCVSKTPFSLLTKCHALVIGGENEYNS